MKLAKKDVLQLSELDSLIMSEIEKIGILKANQLAVLLSTSRQAVAYRLKVLQKRGFLKYVKGIGWQIGTYWKKQSEEQVGSGFEVIVGLDKIVERTKVLLAQNPARTVYAIENIYYKLLSDQEKESWKKMDKQIDAVFVESGCLIKAVGNQDSYRIFMESQAMHANTINPERTVVYKIVPDEVLRLPYEEACSICAIGEYVLHFYFKTEKLEIIKSRPYVDLIAKYYNLAEIYGKQMNVNAELNKILLQNE